MNKDEALQVLEKYKQVSNILGNQSDYFVISEIIKYMSNDNTLISNTIHTLTKKPKYGCKEFEQLILQKNEHIWEQISPNINIHRHDMQKFWEGISDEEKSSYTIFELNVILYCISNQYKKYQTRDKKAIIKTIDEVVKSKNLQHAYNDLIV